MRTLEAKSEIIYRLTSMHHFNPMHRQGDRLRAVFLFGHFPPDGSGAGALF
jgi:hypothetical protein